MTAVNEVIYRLLYNKIESKIYIIFWTFITCGQSAVKDNFWTSCNMDTVKSSRRHIS